MALHKSRWIFHDKLGSIFHDGFSFGGTLCCQGTPEGGGEYESQVLDGAGAGAAAAEPDDASFKIAYATICPEEQVKEGKTQKKKKKKKRDKERERERERERSIHLRKFGFV
jgi:hypothetical protein